MVFSYSGWPGLFLSFIANGAQRHHRARPPRRGDRLTRLARVTCREIRHSQLPPDVNFARTWPGQTGKARQVIQALRRQFRCSPATRPGQAGGEIMHSKPCIWRLRSNG